MTADCKKFYWIKLKNNYFNQLKQKKMRKQPHGAELQIIYLKIMMLSMTTNGMLYYEGVYDTIAEEIAENINEDIELVNDTLTFCSANDMLTISENQDIFILEVSNCTGSETSDAARKREERLKKSNKGQCPDNVRQHTDNVLQYPTKSINNGKSHTEIELELDKELERENSKSTLASASPVHTIPTKEELRSACTELNITNVDIDIFYDYYNDLGWIDKYGRNINHRSKLLKWSKTEREKPPKKLGVMDFEQSKNDAQLDEMEPLLLQEVNEGMLCSRNGTATT